jgi:glucokinase
VVDGRLVEGSSGTAGEIGHVTIDRSGPPCKCGNVGCLEAIASGTAIARRFQEQRDAGRETLADSWLNGREATAADVAKAAREGDRLASEIFNDAAEAVGIGVVNCIHLLNPDVIAIGGGVTKAGNLLFDGLRRVVDRTAFPVPRKIVSIVPAQLGEEVGLIGAAAIAADDLRRELDTVLVSQ